MTFIQAASTTPTKEEDREITFGNLRLLRYVVMFLSCGLVFIGTFEASGRVIYVSGTGNEQDGLTWQTAFLTIQDAIDVAVGGDQIWVAAGTYPDNVTIPKAVNLFGGFSGTETDQEFDLRNPSVHETKIDIENRFETAITVEGGVTIEGLIITRARGAAVYVKSGSLDIGHCTLTGNRALNGGGMALTNATVNIDDCTITSNSAERGGGGLYIIKSTVTLTDCLIAGNTAGHGGGVASGGTLVMKNCIVRGNYAAGGDLAGGGLYVGGELTLLENCLIHGNGAGGFDDPRGSQVYFASVRDVAFNLVNCTIKGRVNGFAWNRLPPTITGSIIVGSPEIFPPVHDSPADATVSYSCIEGGGYPGEGNINVDPLFVDPNNGDFRLKPESPCIDTGSTIGPDDDLDGNPRPVDVPGVGRDGSDAYDMGAYEFQEGVLPPNADLDGDGKVDAKDLMLLQLQWQSGK